MDKEYVVKMCSNKSPEELSKTYKKQTLVQMYITLYGIELQGRKTANDIAYDIWNFLADEERTKDLCKLLR